jgi:hypothetical protein
VRIRIRVRPTIPGRARRWVKSLWYRRLVSVDNKVKAVLRLASGEEAEAVAADIRVSLNRLRGWEAIFISGGVDALETYTNPPEEEEPGPQPEAFTTSPTK